MPSIPQTEEIVKQPRSNFYVYALARPAEPDTPSHFLNADGSIVFYIGKGKAERWKDHESCARNQVSCKHRTCHVIRKVWRQGQQITRMKILERTSEENAHSAEVLLIAYARSEGWPIVNITPGGDGFGGYAVTRDKLTEQERKRRGERLKHVWDSPEVRERQRQTVKQQWTDPAIRDKRNMAWHSPSVREKAGKSLRGKPPTHSGTYEGFVSPDGIVYSPVHNLMAFGRTHGLSQPGLTALNSGKIRTHRGWTKYIPSGSNEPLRTYSGSGFVSPDGTVYESIDNLSKFCSEHGLSMKQMSKVNTGKSASHQGWIRYPVLEKPPRCTYSGSGFVSPSGTVYQASDIPSLKEFCQEHGLEQTCMSMLSKGKIKTHKGGWTRYDPDIDQPTLL